MTSVNYLLKAVRVRRGMRQVDLANKIGRSESWVCQLERNQIEPSDLDVALICRALEVVEPKQIFPEGQKAD